MKLIILAAGQGIRLSPLTDDKPKCMVEYQDKMIIDYIYSTAMECHINDIVVVGGYKYSILKEHLGEKVKFYKNNKFDRTNMVSTLFCAAEELNDDIIISYADIIYEKNVLEKLINSASNLSCVIDLKWRDLWSQRMENPLEDAETLKLNPEGHILELGKKATGYDEIEGQYIGLIKISKSAVQQIKDFYLSLDENAMYDGKDFDNMYMTSFLQKIIDDLMPIKAVEIEGGWLEVDCVDDLKSKML